MYSSDHTVPFDNCLFMSDGLAVYITVPFDNCLFMNDGLAV